MKKFFVLSAIILLAFTACEQPTGGSSEGQPSLTIRNQSSVTLTNVKFSDIPFTASGSNDLPASTQSVKQLTADDVGKTYYINFSIKEFNLDCRTTDALTITENHTFTFTDQTIVEELGNSSNRGALSQIDHLPGISLVHDGRSVTKNETVPLGETVSTYTTTHDFDIRNTGNGKLLLTGTTPVRLDGDTDVFTVIQPASSEVAANGSLSFKINFRPTEEKIYTAIVTISSNDQGGAFTFNITATGTPSKPIAVVIYDNNEVSQLGIIDAGELLLSQSKNITVGIRNTGTEVLSITRADITITGDDAEAFSVSVNPNASVPVNGQTSLIIQYSPVKEGINNAILSIPTNDDYRDVIIVYLRGEAVKGTAIFELSQGATVITSSSTATPFDFGLVELGSSSVSMVFTIRNSGDVPLELTGNPVFEITNSVFAVSQEPSNKTINPNASTTFSLRYTPVLEGETLGTITIPYNDGEQFILNVKGTGWMKKPQISVYQGETEILHNGTLNVGEVLITQYKEFSVTIKNSGEELLIVDTENITISGTHAAAFTKQTNPGDNISVGGESSFTIRYTPTNQGENNAILQIPTNDASRSPFIVYLRANAVTGLAIVDMYQNETRILNNDPTPVDFGRIELGSSSNATTFTIANTGNIALQLTGDPLVASSNPVFAISLQPSSSTVQGGMVNAVTFNVRYTPTSEGEDTGTITIFSNATVPEFSFTVKGTGYVKKPQITVQEGDTVIDMYGEHPFGTILVDKTTELTFSIINSGEANLTINAVDGKTINLDDNTDGFFSVNTNLLDGTIITPGNSRTFILGFAPTRVANNLSATVRINTNSGGENSDFLFTVTGNGRGYIIGDTGPAGGLIFYDKGSFSDGWQYLEAAPAEIEFVNVSWGPSNIYGTNIDGTTAALGSGKQNTELIVAQFTTSGETGRAAQLCTDLTFNGYSDWFLPSRNELDLMYQNLCLNGLGSFNTLNSSASYYWSSTQYSGESAWRISFYSGTWEYATKSVITYKARAIRSF